jgi:hypothetical protein
METAAILQIIQLALAATPKVIDLARDTKDWVDALFRAGVITAEQQNAVHAYVDAVCDAALRGEPPPHWSVEPDPST